MKRKIFTIIILGCFMLSSFAGFSTTGLKTSTIKINSTQLEWINIDGNNDFTPEKGVTGGSGTEDDPYIIGGWELDMIFISNTNVYFIIKNCIVSNDYEMALWFDNVINGKIKDCRLYAAHWSTIYFMDTNDCVIENCDISSTALWGISLVNSNNIIIRNCNIHDCKDWGIRIMGSNNNEIFGCNIWNTYFGIELEIGVNNKIHHNNFYKNTYNAGDFSLNINNKWDDGSEGNYWDDYFGNGDTPHLINFNKDRYPSMKAYNKESKPPNKPIITGPTNGKPGQEYTFDISSVDPDGHSLKYGFDWDRDLKIDQWTCNTYYESGQTAKISHTWNKMGTYEIRVIARDIYGYQSPLSESFTITIAKSRSRIYDKTNELNGAKWSKIQANVYMYNFETLEISVEDELVDIENMNPEETYKNVWITGTLKQDNGFAYLVTNWLEKIELSVIGTIELIANILGWNDSYRLEMRFKYLEIIFYNYFPDAWYLYEPGETFSIHIGKMTEFEYDFDTYNERYYIDCDGLNVKIYY